MSKKNLHVVQRPNGDWVIRRAGSARATSSHATQTEAERKATKIARKEKGQVFIHRTNGRIRDVKSFKN